MNIVKIYNADDEIIKDELVMEDQVVTDETVAEIYTMPEEEEIVEEVFEFYKMQDIPLYYGGDEAMFKYLTDNNILILYKFGELKWQYLRRKLRNPSATCAALTMV